MAWCEIQFSGKQLGKMATMNVFLPNTGEGPFPVLYLLHGYSDNHTAWQRRTRLECYLEEREMIVVMPDGHTSFYLNDPRHGGHPWEDHIVQDVVGFVDRNFPTCPERAARGIAGLSMGGYGAFRLGMKYCNMFAAASSHSGALLYATAPVHGVYKIEQLMGEHFDLDEVDCAAWARKVASDPLLPALRFDCGRDDFLYKQNVAFAKLLTELNITHDYKEYPGVHNWGYWDEHITETLDFMQKHLHSR